MAVQPFEGATFPGVEVTTYKDEPGTWVGVTRRVLADASATKFETRFFDRAPGGYTSYERHAHEHVVIVLTGKGTVRLGDTVHTISAGDVVHTGPNEPHQFLADAGEGLGIVCTVDRERDKPVLLGNDGLPRASE